ncbi:PREDICTED: single-stranded DNA-binding protein, mitochondrial-like [Nelumbo nucifera]|uniref:Single-stranded DNA-binding protein, mitochondrial-like n=1 Tax=Nelumbo nucifera TaxID=4432 RepID=A0A1U8A7J1_NELNU|nr:PREDICTED: single-stranded DNA-binding protein, mitochondrial-like [Nelumbo nucifera]
MASAMTSLSRRLSRSFISTARPAHVSLSFCTNITSNDESDSDDSRLGFDRNSSSSTTTTTSSSSSSSSSPSSSTDSNQRRPIYQRPLENGIDVGVYKAILIGQVGQSPVQKQLKSGRLVTLFSLGTGGIRNNRKPFENEQPREYADRCAVQWHRVAVYPERLGGLALKNVKPGSMLYVEGNLETKIFSDPMTGLVRRIREIAVRRDGRIVFLSNDGDATQVTPPTQMELKGVGYY